MLQLTKTAADALAATLSIDDSLAPRDALDGPRSFHVQAAPITNADGVVEGYHDALYVVAVSGHDGVMHIL
jgi:hypothetical protein